MNVPKQHGRISVKLHQPLLKASGGEPSHKKKKKNDEHLQSSTFLWMQRKDTIANHP